VSPAIAVCIASHERPVRLRWLLNALEEQTLGDVEVVVCHDSRGEATERLLATHPLARRGALRHHRLPPGTGSAARQRNVAWRAATAPLVAFTDDDCRPPADWLERLAAAARPGAIVQGATRPDPDELALLERDGAARSLRVEPPTAWGETSNIAYPRELLERVGGFDEAFRACEDTDLLQRALATGAPLVAAPDAVTYHAVAVRGTRASWRWEETAHVVKRHPGLRAAFPLRVFWKPRHARLALAVAGLAVRRPALAVPWALAALPSYGRTPRGLARAVCELPREALHDAAEMAAVGRGAVRHRTVVL